MEPFTPFDEVICCSSFWKVIVMAIVLKVFYNEFQFVNSVLYRPEPVCKNLGHAEVEFLAFGFPCWIAGDHCLHNVWYDVTDALYFCAPSWL